MILRLQELEFLFNPVQGLRDSELKGLACSLVRRLQVTSKGDQGRRYEGEGVKQRKVKRREKRMGHKQKNKVRGGKQSPQLEPSVHFRKGESGPSRGPNFSRGSEAKSTSSVDRACPTPWGSPGPERLRRPRPELHRSGPPLPKPCDKDPGDRRRNANSLSAPSPGVTGLH